jgi:hypothetical protein
MEQGTLTEQITALVVEHLAAAGFLSAVPGEETLKDKVPETPARMQKAAKGLLIFTDSSQFLRESWEHFRNLSRFSVEWTAITGEELPPSLLKKELGGLTLTTADSLPSSWKSLVRAVDMVIIPVMTVTLSSKIAHLLGDDVSSRLVIQALMEKKPVLAGMEEITFLTRHSAQLPRPLVTMMSQYSEIIKSMGVREIQLCGIEHEIARLMGAAGTLARGSNVITMSDIEAAALEGRKTLECARGTIVTPLARDFAEKKDLKIVII